MANAGRVSAFDRDEQRAASMGRLLDSAHATCAEAAAADFLTIEPTEPRWRDVEGLLLDPSCSGSGTTFFQVGDGHAEPERFARSQLELLLHAMRFPGLRTIVYSTCSTSEEENEGVVAQALQERPDWRLRRQVLAGWPRRGLPTRGLQPEDAAATLRFCASRDLCLGFFIACFEPVPINQKHAQTLGAPVAKSSGEPTVAAATGGSAKSKPCERTSSKQGDKKGRRKRLKTEGRS